MTHGVVRSRQVRVVGCHDIDLVLSIFATDRRSRRREHVGEGRSEDSGDAGPGRGGDGMYRIWVAVVILNDWARNAGE